MSVVTRAENPERVWRGRREGLSDDRDQHREDGENATEGGKRDRRARRRGTEKGRERTDVKVLRKNRGARLAGRITTTRLAGRRETERSHDRPFERKVISFEVLAENLHKASTKLPQIR